MIRSIFAVIALMIAAFLAASAAAQAGSTAQVGPMPAQASGGDKFPWPDTSELTSKKLPAGAEVKGSLAIRAVQGTADGPAIGAVSVQIELQRRGTTINTIDSRLDEHGVLVLDDLPIGIGVQPVVSVQYADLNYQVTGGLMDASHPQQQLDVVCYESTEQKPDWKVLMRHVMVDEAQQGVTVTEVLVIENPSKRTWVGTKGSAAKAVTTAFALPAHAKDVTLGRGFHKWCCSTLANGTLLNHLPLMPDTTEMVYSYFVPASAGKALIVLSAPAEVDHMMVLVPQSLKPEPAGGLQQGPDQPMGDTMVSTFAASGQHKDQQVSITLTGLRIAAPVVVESSAQSAAKLIATLGGSLIVLATLAIIFLKSGGAARGKTHAA